MSLTSRLLEGEQTYAWESDAINAQSDQRRHKNYFYKLAYFSTYLCFVMLLAHNLKIYTKSQSQTPENTASTAGWNDFVVGVRTKSYEILPIQDGQSVGVATQSSLVFYHGRVITIYYTYL